MPPCLPHGEDARRLNATVPRRRLRRHPRRLWPQRKAIFPWFASRPIAQARAAVLTTLLPNAAELRPWVEPAVRSGPPEAFVVRRHRSVMLDMLRIRQALPDLRPQRPA